VLERVSLGQSRFNVPGISADPRGVAIGQSIALLFPSIDRVVAFFRAFSGEVSLGDVLAALHIFQVETPVRTRELIVLLPAQGSHFVDQGARIARLVGGATFTGTAKHFVLYRDDRSPLGYDSSAIERAECDFAVYGRDFSQTYRKVQELDFGALVKRLAPVPERQRAREPGEAPDPPPPLVWITVRSGLAAPVRGYLWRSGLQAGVAAVSRATDSAFADARTDWALDLALFRVSGAPERILRLFGRLPGAQVFVPCGQNVGIQRGWRHPFTLENCGGAFAGDRFYLFSGEDKRLIEVGSLPVFVPVDQLGAVTFDVDGGRGGPPAADARPLRPARDASFGLELRLLPAAVPPTAVAATIVPGSQLAWLKKLVYALPGALLSAYRVAITPDAAVLLCAQGVDGIPLGTFMEALSPNLFVARGYRFFPAVAPDVLFAHIGGNAQNLYFFLPGQGTPFYVPAEAFVPLERRALASIAVDEAPVAPVPPPLGAPELVNEPVGSFSLWTHRLGDPTAGGEPGPGAGPGPGAAA